MTGKRRSRLPSDSLSKKKKSNPGDEEKVITAVTAPSLDKEETDVPAVREELSIEFYFVLL